MVHLNIWIPIAPCLLPKSFLLRSGGGWWCACRRWQPFFSLHLVVSFQLSTKNNTGNDKVSAFRLALSRSLSPSRAMERVVLNQLLNSARLEGNSPSNEQCSASEKDLIESLMKRFTCEDFLPSSSYSNRTVYLHSWMQSAAQASIMTSDQCLFCLFMDDENKLAEDNDGHTSSKTIIRISRKWWSSCSAVSLVLHTSLTLWKHSRWCDFLGWLRPCHRRCRFQSIWNFSIASILIWLYDMGTCVSTVMKSFVNWGMYRRVCLSREGREGEREKVNSLLSCEQMPGSYVLSQRK